MAAALLSAQDPEPSHHRERLNGGSGKRKRNEAGLEQQTCATESVQAGISQSAINKAQGGSDLRNRHSEEPIGRSRQNSLRHVKDSTDALRERSLQTQRSRKAVAADGITGGREGRKFTVGNVGNNGIIYLRFVSCHMLAQGFLENATGASFTATWTLSY